MKLNLGCGLDVQDPNEWINVDRASNDDRVFKFDIDNLVTMWQSGYQPQKRTPPGLLESFFNITHDISYVKAHHILEHVRQLNLTMRWLHEVCTDGATLDIVVPVAGTLWGVANPDHVRQFNHYTFMYYCRGFQTSDLGLFTGFDMVEQKLEDVGIHKFGGMDFQVGNLHTWMKVVK